MTASSTRSSRKTRLSLNSDMLPAETAEMRKGLLTLALAKVRQKDEAILKNEKQFT